MLDMIYVLEMIGIIAFAISGMIMARSKNMDPVGVFTIGFITALGGGTRLGVARPCTPPPPARPASAPTPPSGPACQAHSNTGTQLLWECQQILVETDFLQHHTRNYK